MQSGNFNAPKLNHNLHYHNPQQFDEISDTSYMIAVGGSKPDFEKDGPTFIRAKDVFDQSSAGGSNIIRVQQLEDDKGSYEDFDETDLGIDSRIKDP